VAIIVRELFGSDLSQDFLDTLTALAETELTPDQAKEVFRERLHRGIRSYVACIDGRVVGTASLLVEEKFIHGGGLSSHIEDVAVHRDFQKQGIGAELVHHLVQEARRLGCYKVILNCREAVAPFYEKLGFRRHDVGMRMDLK
jgi:glucosamine-phosphate N-acetyltransferase